MSDRINSQISGIEDEFQRLSAADSIGRVICDSVGNNEFLAAVLFLSIAIINISW